MASCKSIYDPREDSTLLERYVREHAKGSVLDMGTGSGIQAIAAAQSSRVDSVIAADIMKSAVDYCKKCIKHRKIKKFLVSDLFEGIKRDKRLKNKKFGTIIFNPPYLPNELKVRDLTLEGGKKGYEVIERFLNEVNEFLKPEGIILMVFSSLTRKEKVDEFIRNNLLESEMLRKEHYFFEDLYAYLIKKSGILKELEKNNLKGIKYFAKGKRGLIFTGRYRGRKAAVKINNPESKAFLRMENEAKYLKMLNKQGIGPKLLLSGNGYLAYGFIEGVNIDDFFGNLKEKANGKKIILGIINKIMAQLYGMDKLGINKQEMSHPQKHILIGKRNNPYLIDFERCKHTINPSNITQFCDYIASNSIRTILENNGIAIERDKLIGAARKYKQQRNKNAFDALVRIIGRG